MYFLSAEFYPRLAVAREKNAFLNHYYLGALYSKRIVRRVVYSFDINTNRKWFEHLKHRSGKQSKTVTGGEIIVNTLLRFLVLVTICVLHWYLMVTRW